MHERITELIQAAANARSHAYVPYSRFRVGAAIWGADGRIYTGCNVENASYGLTICAERSAVCSMVQQGCRSIQQIVVLLEGDGTPCGACRQVLVEFGLDFQVYAVNAANGLITGQWKIGELIPNSFAASHIHSRQQSPTD